MAQQLRKHKSLPLKKGADKKLVIDFDQLKKEYLAGPDYNWKQFCDRQGYGITAYKNRERWKERHGIDIIEWRREWIKHHSTLTEEELAGDVLDVKKLVATQRIKFVKDWTKRTEFMKTMMDSLLSAHGQDLQHDMANHTAIIAGRAQKKFKLTGEDLLGFSKLAEVLQNVEMRSLMLVGDSSTQPKINEDGSVEYNDKTAEMDVLTMGTSGMSGQKIAELMNSFFDQSQAKALPAPEVVNEKVQG